MGFQSLKYLCVSTVFFFTVINASIASPETPNLRQASNKISVNNEGKLKRQNEGSGGGAGEEVDLSTINQNSGGNRDAGQNPGQLPFGNNYPFLQQQPFFGNGLGFPGGQPSGFAGGLQPGFTYSGGQQPTFAGGQQPSFTGQSPVFPVNGFGNTFPGYQGFPQGFPQSFPQGNQQFGVPSRNVILQNNGKQYLVQELTENQRVVQKNGKQYLLQPFTGTTGTGLQTFNVPSSALADLRSPFGQEVSLSSLNSAFAGNIPPSGGGYSPVTAGSSAKLTSSAPHGQQYQVDQFPIRSSQQPNYLSQSIGAVAAQLASQATSQQYASQYSTVPFGLGNGGLAQAYNRANEAGYGLYPAGYGDFGGAQAPSKRSAKGVSQQERKKN